METVKQIEVLIVGAGPSGLMMAAQLLRYGIQPMIIDEKPGPDRGSNLTLLHARSMELFRQLGLADQLLSKGKAIYTMEFSGLRGMVAAMDFSRLAQTDVAFPFILGLGQEDVERVLLDRLTENACPVAWKTRLESFSQDDSGTCVVLEHEGTRREWRCAWIIGADGEDSDVRQQLGIRFERDPRMWDCFVADVQAEGSRSRAIRLAFRGRGILAAIPSGVLPGHFRITGRLPHRRGGTTDLQNELLKVFGLNVHKAKFLQLTPFNYRKAVAEQIRRQRCFLIGDAAHGVSPLLSRRLNEGFYDAANLAWKLAGVVNGRMVSRVLDTYQQERLPAVKGSGGVFESGESGERWSGWLQQICLGKQLSRISRDPNRMAQAFLRLAGLNVNYRRSPLSVHHALGTGVHAGDRIPCLPVFDEKTKTQTDLHRWCEKPGFVLLVLGTVGHHQLNIIGQWVKQKYPREMHLYYLPYSRPNQQIFDAFEVNPAGTKIMLVRPDMHIAYMNDVLNVSLIDTYMEEILEWAFFGHPPEKR